jgi:transketolase
LRATFVNTLLRLAERDPRALLLTGDLGYRVLEPFAEKLPDRFFNVGVAEQNLLGVATGLAEAGFIPFVYSIATFLSMRAYEFIRNGPVHHMLPVRMVGIGGGFEYGPAGFSHHALEDLGILRLQPGLTVIAPADAPQARAAFEATWDVPGPVYYRLGKNERAVVPGLEGRFALGRVERIGDGSDLLILATGAIAVEAEKANRLLARSGVRATLAVVAGLVPAPEAELARLMASFGVVVTVEAHYRIGALGSLACEVAAEHGLRCRVVRCGAHGRGDGLTGSQSWLEERHGLSARAVAETAVAALRSR